MSLKRTSDWIQGGQQGGQEYLLWVVLASVRFPGFVEENAAWNFREKEAEGINSI
jgi:hypothetical protein